MVTAFIAVIALVICFSIILLWVLNFRKNKFGILSGDLVYSDTERKPGLILYSHSINLAGKPDYIIKNKEGFLPVEVKTGNTPREPYENHVMQLMSYCFLVEENYSKKPIGGYLKYPDKEFKILYTAEAREAVIRVVKKITELKISREELYCKHPEHNNRILRKI